MPVRAEFDFDDAKYESLEKLGKKLGLSVREILNQALTIYAALGENESLPECITVESAETIYKINVKNYFGYRAPAARKDGKVIDIESFLKPRYKQ